MVLNHMFVPGESPARSAATHTGKECNKMTKNMGLGAQRRTWVQTSAPTVMGMCTWHGGDHENVRHTDSSSQAKPLGTEGPNSGKRHVAEVT